MVDRVLRYYLLEHIAGEDPRITVRDRSDRCCAFVILQQGDLAKSDHLYGIAAVFGVLAVTWRCWLRLEDLFEGYLLGEMWVFGVRFRLVNGDSHLPIGEHEVVRPYIPVLDYELTCLELALVHGLCEQNVILRVYVFREERGREELDQRRLTRFRLNVDWWDKTLELRALQVEGLVEDRASLFHKIVDFGSFGGLWFHHLVEDMVLKFTRRNLGE